MAAKDIAAALGEVLSKLIAQQNQQFASQQALQNQHFATLLAEVSSKTSSPNINMVDTRGMGRPPPFSGMDKEWREWKGKVTAYLYATAPHAKPYLDWAEVSAAPITQSLMEDKCTDDQGNLATDALQSMAQFSTRLGLILVDTCKGEPYRIVESAGHGNGLEAWRLLMRRYASRTPGTKRALLASLFSMKPAVSAMDFESVLLTVEEIIRRYDAMSATNMPEDIACAILIAVCPKDLKEFLDMSTEEFKYAELRNRATNWIERKRDQHGKQLADMERRNNGHAPMDVSWFGDGSSEEDWHDSEIQGVQDWGGYMPQPSNPEYSWTDEVQSMQKGYKGKSKGKGKHGKGYYMGKGTGTQVLTGSSYGKGAGTQTLTGFSSFKGSQKGSWKGSSKGKGQFNGECHYCGKWGHTARDCALKDTHMAQWRQSTQTSSVEDHDAEHDQGCDHDNHVSALETSGGHRNMGTWELSNLMTKCPGQGQACHKIS